MWMVKCVLRTYFFYISFVFSLIVPALLLPVWHLLGQFDLKKAQRRFGYYVSSNWARFLLLTAGVKVAVKGLENIPSQETVLFISNHQGNFDIPVLFSCLKRPVGFLAKVELARVPVLHSWMPKLGCVYIDRGDPRQAVGAVQQCIEVLKNGQSMVIFPEGTRSRGPVMGEFKKGSMRLAEKAGVPIVPVTINGTYKVMEANRNRIRPADVSVTVSPPIYFTRLSKKEQDNINNIIHETISKNLT